MRYIWLLLVAFVLTATAWTIWPAAWTLPSARARTQPSAPDAAGTDNRSGDAGTSGTALVEALRAALDSARIRQTQPELTAAEQRHLAAAYQAVSGQPLWLDATGRPGADAREAVALLERAFEDGLVPEDYHASDLARRAALSPGSPADAAAFDLDLTARLQLYLRDLHVGRVDPRTIGFKMTAPRDDHDFASTVREAAANHEVKGLPAAWAPPLALYRNLRGALAKYRELAADTTLTALPAPAATARAVRRGDSYEGAEPLARLLVALGDLPAGEAPADGTRTYDDRLTGAVARFQARHGIEGDGVMGAATQEALRVPLSWRVRQVELALERLRWLPHLGPGRLVAVNVPMFRLWAWDDLKPDGVPSYESRVIVGRALDTETPVFVEEMDHIIFQPYWNIPTSIARGEIVPAIAKDPQYLEKQNMELVAGGKPVEATGDALARLRDGTLAVRQRPGPKNSLGRVKFVFPNDENVYLHDTPAQGLFDRTRRDFSHGCVRVEHPERLAEWVLRGQDGWTSETVAAAMRATDTRRVNLKEPLRVILFYVTAVVTPQDGVVHFANDIYKHDGRLDRALTKRVVR